MSDDLRPLTATDQSEALALWQSVFGTPPGFFERYFDAHADPHFQPGDTLGAWANGQLVSAVHLCRRPVAWDGGTLLCGAIANVATLPDARRQGLSRRLLEMAVDNMAGEGFDYSLLGTGVPGHYAPLKWEQIHGPRVTIQPLASLVSASEDWQSFETTDALAALYAQSPRPAQFLRPPVYFEHWVGWGWRQNPLRLHCDAAGYALLAEPPDGAFAVAEWRAADAESEGVFLRAAAARAAHAGRALALPVLPQHNEADFLQTLGAVVMHQDNSAMLRNVRMDAGSYERLLSAYRSGLAAWWPGDAF